MMPVSPPDGDLQSTRVPYGYNIVPVSVDLHVELRLVLLQ